MVAPVVLLLEPTYAQHDHAKSLWDDGFRIVPVPASEATISQVLAVRPAIVAAELVAAQAVHTLHFARLLRETPQTRAIPFIVYAEHLYAQDVDSAARAGAFWVHLAPGNSAKLAGAVRGVLRVTSLMARPSLHHLDLISAQPSAQSSG